MPPHTWLSPTPFYSYCHNSSSSTFSFAKSASGDLNIPFKRLKHAFLAPLEGRKSAQDFVQLLTLYKSRSKYKYTKPPAGRTYKRQPSQCYVTPGICSMQLSCIDCYAFKTVLYLFLYRHGSGMLCLVWQGFLFAGFMILISALEMRRKLQQSTQWIQQSVFPHRCTFEKSAQGTCTQFCSISYYPSHSSKHGQRICNSQNCEWLLLLFLKRHDCYY